MGVSSSIAEELVAPAIPTFGAHQCKNGLSTKPLLFDVSTEYMDFMGSIERLQWRELGQAMDRYLAYPTVRCPWGFSKFPHKTNQLCFETLLWHLSNCCFPVYAHAIDNNGWTRSIRQDDYVSIPEWLLYSQSTPYSYLSVATTYETTHYHVKQKP